LLFAYVVLILYMVWMIKFMAGLEVEVKKWIARDGIPWFSPCLIITTE
jgi:hypothetical protein